MKAYGVIGAIIALILWIVLFNILLFKEEPKSYDLSIFKEADERQATYERNIQIYENKMKDAVVVWFWHNARQADKIEYVSWGNPVCTGYGDPTIRLKFRARNTYGEWTNEEYVFTVNFIREDAKVIFAEDVRAKGIGGL